MVFRFTRYSFTIDTPCSEKKEPFFSGGPELFSNVVSEQDENEEVLVLTDPSCAERSFQKALKGL